MMLFIVNYSKLLYIFIVQLSFLSIDFINNYFFFFLTIFLVFFLSQISYLKQFSHFVFLFLSFDLFFFLIITSMCFLYGMFVFLLFCKRILRLSLAIFSFSSFLLLCVYYF